MPGPALRSLDPDGRIEQRLWGEGFRLVAGVDEVGRGAIAGPLVVCGVILPEGFELPGLRDSKLLAPPDRERIAAEVRRCAVSLTLVRVTPSSIDRRGLHRSNLRALRQAALRLRPRPEYLLVDGYPIERPTLPALAIRKGDRVSLSVAAASVVAKVSRDRAMRRLHRRHPEYAWKHNKGYGTPEHWRALRSLGPTPQHRLSFAGVGQMSLWSPEEEDQWFEGEAGEG